jgi:hypothetical protein
MFCLLRASTTWALKVPNFDVMQGSWLWILDGSYVNKAVC